MDMAEQLDDMTYRLLASAASRTEALQRVAIMGHWAEEQAARLQAGRTLRLDHDQMVSEALASPRAASTAA
jgi:hypothetical protein